VARCSLVSVAPQVGEGLSRTARNVAQSVFCAFNSFEAGTMVETIDGPVPIEDIGVGTYVLGYNEETGEIGYYPVTDLISHLDFKVVYLTIDGEVIVTTAEHPFYTAEGEWVDAIDLRVGDEIRTAEWATGVVESVYEVTRPQLMYNFTVDVAHTYFVGENQWLVHNSNCRNAIALGVSGGHRNNYHQQFARRMGNHVFSYEMWAHRAVTSDPAARRMVNDPAHFWTFTFPHVMNNDELDVLFSLEHLQGGVKAAYQRGASSNSNDWLSWADRELYLIINNDKWFKKTRFFGENDQPIENILELIE